MKLFWAVIASVLAIVLGFVLVVPKQEKPFTSAQKATHMVIFLDKEGEPDSMCTATAIGPHAILTAAHCNKDEIKDTVQLDYSEHKYHLLAYAHDDRDHVVYILDGPSFTNFKHVLTRQSAFIGESVVIYGCGGRVYPPVEKTGIRIDSHDPSDIDANNRLDMFSINVIPGDSGSGVFDNDGNLVAVISYVWGGDNTAGFELHFSKEQLDAAFSFGL